MKIDRLFIFYIILICINLLADGVQPEGSGTEVDPYQVEILDNLLWISTNSSSWDKDFIQTADIDASDTQNWNNGGGFVTIAIDSVFTGNYNGLNHTIDSLYINHSLSYPYGPGLFCIATNTIQNLGLINVNIITGQYGVGGLIGINGGTIINCYTTGDVNGDGYYTGGLVGRNYFNGNIINCYSTCNVNGHSGVGGLVGLNSNNATIINCYSIGNVNGNGNVGGLIGQNGEANVNNSYCSGDVSGNYNIGGLVGNNYFNGNIINCYSLGAVSGTDFIGGLVGDNEYNGNIDKCYSIGQVDGMNQTGGLVGNNDSSIVNNSFFDMNTSGQTTSFGGTGKTTIEMHNVATYTSLNTIGLTSAWDFVGNPFDDYESNDYWDIDSEINDGYPYFTNPYVVGIETEMSLLQNYNISNYPNPFNPSTTIEFSIQTVSKVKLSIYNIKGQKIKTLANNEFNKGSYSIIWNGVDESGKPVSSGLYFYKLNVNSKIEATKKMLLLK